MTIVDSLRGIRHSFATILFSAGIASLLADTEVRATPTGSGTAIESGGLVVVEAEDFHSQEKTGHRQWTLVNDGEIAAQASGGSFLQVLPDTRTTHDDEIKHGVNFSNESGVIAVLNFPIRFQTPGRYYVWARAFSTGKEDNGIHAGIDDTWPESGRKMQWCIGKGTWRWESMKRTQKNHCGEPHQIFVEVPDAGIHVVQFSMREDGFRFDRFLLTLDRGLARPTDEGPPANPTSGGGVDPRGASFVK